MTAATLSACEDPDSRPRTLILRLIAASLAAAGAIFGGLAVQMAHGHDPALGAGTSERAATGGPRSQADRVQRLGSRPATFQDQSALRPPAS